jgi:hypothetical protein
LRRSGASPRTTGSGPRWRCRATARASLSAG